VWWEHSKSQNEREKEKRGRELERTKLVLQHDLAS
jgi:hypothetical protein